MRKPQLNKVTFWDVDFENMDFEKNKNFIIRRVFERGKWDEVIEVITFYNESTVVAALVSASYLMQVAIDIACILFKVKPTEFKCYASKQFHPNL